MDRPLRIGVAEIRVENDALHPEEEILITGPTTGVYEERLGEIRLERDPVPEAGKGCLCSIPVRTRVRKNDKVYKLVPACDAPF